MKQRTQMISARLRNYGKNSTKISDECQLELEIRNYIDKPIRISAKNGDGSLIQLKKQNLKKGVCIGRNDANLINARINKLKVRLQYVMQFLIYSGKPINKTVIEEFAYLKWHDVYSFFTDVTDGEDAEVFFKYLNQSIEDNQKEAADHNQFLMTIGAYQATGFIEGLNMHDFENCRKETIVPNFTKWCKSIGVKDYPISKFDKKAFDSFVRFTIQLPRKRLKKGDVQYYSVKTIDNMVKEIRIYLKALIDNGYSIDQTALDFKVIKGNRKNAHIKFINNELDNVISITASELSQIRNAVNDTKLPKDLKRAATLFSIQTLLGGLRISELNKITKDSFRMLNDRYYCFFSTDKTKKMIDSPLHSELLPILQSIDFDLGKIKFRTDDDYNDALKRLAVKLNFNRDIVQLDSRANANNQDVVTKKLHNVFTSKFARKAAITILFSTGKYSNEQIAKMTKHSLNAIQYYIAVLNDDKANMMDSL